MNKGEQIRQLFRRMAGEQGPAPTMLATCTAVNEGAETCTLRDELDLDYEVRLRPTIGTGEAVTIIPALGAQVIAVRIEDDEEWVVMAADSVSKVRMVAGDTTVEMEDGVLISRAGDGLREILDDLITEIQAIYAPKNVANIEAIRLRVTQLLKTA